MCQSGRASSFRGTLIVGTDVSYYWDDNFQWLNGKVVKKLRYGLDGVDDLNGWTLDVKFEDDETWSLAFRPNEKRWKYLSCPPHQYVNKPVKKIIEGKAVSNKNQSQSIVCQNERGKYAASPGQGASSGVCSAPLNERVINLSGEKCDDEVTENHITDQKVQHEGNVVSSLARQEHAFKNHPLTIRPSSVMKKPCNAPLGSISGHNKIRIRSLYKQEFKKADIFVNGLVGQPEENVSGCPKKKHQSSIVSEIERYKMYQTNLSFPKNLY